MNGLVFPILYLGTILGSIQLHHFVSSALPTPLTKSNQNATLWCLTSFGFLFFTMVGVELQNFVSLDCERGRYLFIFILSFMSKNTFNSSTNIQFSNWHWQELCGWKWGSLWQIVSWGTPGPEGPSIPLKLPSRDFVGKPAQWGGSCHQLTQEIPVIRKLCQLRHFSLITESHKTSWPSQYHCWCESEKHKRMIEGTGFTQGKLLIMYFYANKRRQNNFHEDVDH